MKNLMNNPKFWAMAVVILGGAFLIGLTVFLVMNFLNYLGLPITFFRTLQGLIVLSILGQAARTGVVTVRES